MFNQSFRSIYELDRHDTQPRGRHPSGSRLILRIQVRTYGMEVRQRLAEICVEEDGRRVHPAIMKQTSKKWNRIKIGWYETNDHRT